jgi:VanZ family protein
VELGDRAEHLAAARLMRLLKPVPGDAEQWTARMTTKLVLRIFSVTALVVLTFVALGPATWQPRSGIGFEIDHFVGYFVFTLMFCLAWPQPFLVGGALTAFAVVLEGLQAFMPDRSSYYMAAVYSAAGVLAATLLVELFIRARRRFQSKWADGDSAQNA